MKFHPKRGINNSHDPLRINKDSHMIKKPPSSSVVMDAQQQKKRHPVIIYTHAPKVIQTNPRDFMALVQKLTGLSQPKLEHQGHVVDKDNYNHKKVVGNEDKETWGSSNHGDNQRLSCFMSTPIVEPFVKPYVPVFTPSSADFMGFNPMLFNQTTDSFLLSNSSAIPSSTNLEGMKNDFREY